MSTSSSDATSSDKAVLRRYCLARGISVLGSSFSVTALPLAVLFLTGSATLVGLTVAGMFVPYLVLGIFAGTLADRFDRKTLMVVANLGSAVAIGSLPVADLLGRVSAGHLALAAVSSAGFMVIFDAANLAAMPSLFPGDRLTTASSAVWSVTTVADMGGPVLAAAVLLWVDPINALLIDAVSFVVAAVLVQGISVRTQTVRQGGRGVPGWTELAAGFAFLVANRELRTVTVAATGLSVTGGAFFATIAIIDRTTLGGAADGHTLGFLMTAFSAGSVAAAFVMPRIVARVGHGSALLTGLILNLVSAGALAASTSRLAAIAALLVYGSSFALVNMCTVMIRQRLTPDLLQGRTNIAGRIVASSLGRAAGAAVGGLLAGTYGPRLALGVLMCGVALSVLWSIVAKVTTIDLRSRPAADG